MHSCKPWQKCMKTQKQLILSWIIQSKSWLIQPAIVLMLISAVHYKCWPERLHITRPTSWVCLSALVLTQLWTYLLIFALVLTQQSQVVQLLSNIRMVLSKHLQHKSIQFEQNTYLNLNCYSTHQTISDKIIWKYDANMNLLCSASSFWYYRQDFDLLPTKC